jgi:hypothetical protein
VPIAAAASRLATRIAGARKGTQDRLREQHRARDEPELEEHKQHHDPESRACQLAFVPSMLWRSPSGSRPSAVARVTSVWASRSANDGEQPFSARPPLPAGSRVPQVQASRRVWSLSRSGRLSVRARAAGAGRSTGSPISSCFAALAALDHSPVGR